ncbi:hypothetical protein QBZ16_002449 [Prototheca wickerhamii]|uniref:PI3K/PI4K catalytic domain-containing protein n=1 Tax=Prototheca wickerhamii TaxID=3111 RepID=A0AAD9ILY9_PROWI|nr:hypothetical protein QBZ16_002449 [Prototheca wickerhamii]
MQVVTFDGYGVSGHQNHIATAQGVQLALLSRPDIALYELRTRPATAPNAEPERLVADILATSKPIVERIACTRLLAAQLRDATPAGRERLLGAVAPRAQALCQAAWSGSHAQLSPDLGKFLGDLVGHLSRAHSRPLSAAAGPVCEWALSAAQAPRAGPAAVQASALQALSRGLGGASEFILARYATASLLLCVKLLESDSTRPELLASICDLVAQAAKHTPSLKAQFRNLVDLLLGWGLDPIVPVAARPRLCLALAACREGWLASEPWSVKVARGLAADRGWAGGSGAFLARLCCALPVCLALAAVPGRRAFVQGLCADKLALARRVFAGASADERLELVRLVDQLKPMFEDPGTWSWSSLQQKLLDDLLVRHGHSESLNAVLAWIGAPALSHTDSEVRSAAKRLASSAGLLAHAALSSADWEGAFPAASWRVLGGSGSDCPTEPAGAPSSAHKPFLDARTGALLLAWLSNAQAPAAIVVAAPRAGAAQRPRNGLPLSAQSEAPLTAPPLGVDRLLLRALRSRPGAERHSTDAALLRAAVRELVEAGLGAGYPGLSLGTFLSALEAAVQRVVACLAAVNPAAAAPKRQSGLVAEHRCRGRLLLDILFALEQHRSATGTVERPGPARGLGMSPSRSASPARDRTAAQSVGAFLTRVRSLALQLAEALAADGHIAFHGRQMLLDIRAERLKEKRPRELLLRSLTHAAVRCLDPGLLAGLDAELAPGEDRVAKLWLAAARAHAAERYELALARYGAINSEGAACSAAIGDTESLGKWPVPSRSSSAELCKACRDLAEWASTAFVPEDGVAGPRARDQGLRVLKTVVASLRGAGPSSVRPAPPPDEILSALSPDSLPSAREFSAMACVAGFAEGGGALSHGGSVLCGALRSVTAPSLAPALSLLAAERAPGPPNDMAASTLAVAATAVRTGNPKIAQRLIEALSDDLAPLQSLRRELVLLQAGDKASGPMWTRLRPSFDACCRGGGAPEALQSLVPLGASLWEDSAARPAVLEALKRQHAEEEEPALGQLWQSYSYWLVDQPTESAKAEALLALCGALRASGASADAREPALRLVSLLRGRVDASGGASALTEPELSACLNIPASIWLPILRPLLTVPNEALLIALLRQIGAIAPQQVALALHALPSAQRLAARAWPKADDHVRACIRNVQAWARRVEDLALLWEERAYALVTELAAALSRAAKSHAGAVVQGASLAALVVLFRQGLRALCAERDLVSSEPDASSRRGLIHQALTQLSDELVKLLAASIGQGDQAALASARAAAVAAMRRIAPALPVGDVGVGDLLWSERSDLDGAKSGPLAEFQRQTAAAAVPLDWTCADGTTIAAFAPRVRVLTTKTRPKVVTLLGSDGLERRFLLKGSEDVGMHAGILSALDLASRAAAAEDARLAGVAGSYRFMVLGPTTGLIEWLGDAASFYELYNAAVAGVGADGGNRAHPSQPARPVELYRRALRAVGVDPARTPRKSWPADRVLAAFRRLQRASPGEALSDALLAAAAGPDAWWRAQGRFARCTGLLSVRDWLFGIGDRHLDNTLLVPQTGACCPIDFDVLFDRGQRLAVPERVPFRLTRCMLRALGPAGELSHAADASLRAVHLEAVATERAASVVALWQRRLGAQLALLRLRRLDLVDAEARLHRGLAVADKRLAALGALAEAVDRASADLLGGSSEPRRRELELKNALDSLGAAERAERELRQAYEGSLADAVRAAEAAKASLEAWPAVRDRACAALTALAPEGAGDVLLSSLAAMDPALAPPLSLAAIFAGGQTAWFASAAARAAGVDSQLTRLLAERAQAALALADGLARLRGCLGAAPAERVVRAARAPGEEESEAAILRAMSSPSGGTQIFSIGRLEWVSRAVQALDTAVVALAELRLAVAAGIDEEAAKAAYARFTDATSEAQAAAVIGSEPLRPERELVRFMDFDPTAAGAGKRIGMALEDEEDALGLYGDLEPEDGAEADGDKTEDDDAPAWLDPSLQTRPTDLMEEEDSDLSPLEEGDDDNEACAQNQVHASCSPSILATSREPAVALHSPEARQLAAQLARCQDLLGQAAEAEATAHVGRLVAAAPRERLDPGSIATGARDCVPPDLVAELTASVDALGQVEGRLREWAAADAETQASLLARGKGASQEVQGRVQARCGGASGALGTLTMTILAPWTRVESEARLDTITSSRAVITALAAAAAAHERCLAAAQALQEAKTRAEQQKRARAEREAANARLRASLRELSGSLGQATRAVSKASPELEEISADTALQELRQALELGLWAAGGRHVDAERLALQLEHLLGLRAFCHTKLTTWMRELEAALKQAGQGSRVASDEAAGTLLELAGCPVATQLRALVAALGITTADEMPRVEAVVGPLTRELQAPQELGHLSLSSGLVKDLDLVAARDWTALEGHKPEPTESEEDVRADLDTKFETVEVLEKVSMLKSEIPQGWNEDNATDSEADVKADHVKVTSIEALDEYTIETLKRAVFALPVSGLRPVAGCARVGGRCFSELSEKSNDDSSRSIPGAKKAGIPKEWKEEDASSSEATVKAERTEASIEEIKEQSIKKVKQEKGKA